MVIPIVLTGCETFEEQVRTENLVEVSVGEPSRLRRTGERAGDGSSTSHGQSPLVGDWRAGAKLATNRTRGESTPRGEST